MGAGRRGHDERASVVLLGANSAQEEREIYLRVCLELLAQLLQLLAGEGRSRSLLVGAQLCILRLLVLRLGSSGSRACHDKRMCACLRVREFRASALVDRMADMR